MLSPNPSWPDARRLDVRAPAYERWLLDRVVPPALAGPVNGLFLDTADTALDLERTDPRRFKGAAQALERVLVEMKRRHPRALLMINGGLPVAERLPTVLDAVALESIWTDYDFKAKAYRVRPADEAEARALLLARVVALGLPVFTLEYTAADRGAPWPAELIRALAHPRASSPTSRRSGSTRSRPTPWRLEPRMTRRLSRRALLGRSAAAAGVLALRGPARGRPRRRPRPARARPRRASCRATCWRCTSPASSSTTWRAAGPRPPTLNEVHSWAQMPLNWLGLMVEYHDIDRGLPDTREHVALPRRHHLVPERGDGRAARLPALAGRADAGRAPGGDSRVPGRASRSPDSQNRRSGGGERGARAERARVPRQLDRQPEGHRAPAQGSHR